ncbi:transmembrane protein 82-like [Acanthochromis polyacanthus]|uniref:transmembrane protein 82-like n=1 Tax=Acanthochromis polyacanthus TaxID=80966 RepID=UPI0022345A77|nr:transmembrane protein 82-like [Acanthochromis polyacanthus]
MFFPLSWILGTSEWNLNLVDCFFRGLVGACGISVLCNLMRVYNFIQTCIDSETDNGDARESSSAVGRFRAALQFWSLTVLLSLVGSRVSSLIVLEFSLRAIAAWASAGLDASGRGVDLLLIQCQFSLGCSLTCTLDFLHQGAPHSSLGLFLAAALSWALANYSHDLWNHVARLYPLHSRERYCGKCITLLTSGHTILASLQRAVLKAFAVAAVASTATVYDHFLSQKDALKFWTPLTLCYTMLVVYIQEEQHRQTGPEVLLHTVVVRLGALLVLMLTVGTWSDVLQVLTTFFGEAVCLLPSQDLLQAVLKVCSSSCAFLSVFLAFFFLLREIM